MPSLPFIAVPPSKARAMIIQCLMAGLVPYTQSSPGIGKSELIQAIADEYRLKVLDLRLSQCDVTDLNGLPRFTEAGRAEFAPFTYFPIEGDPLPVHPDGGTYEGWLIFFDELSSAPKQLQAAAYKVILDKMVGLHKLHPQALLACAGNLETDRAVVHAMSTALQSRLIHIEMQVDHKEWLAWAIKQGVDSRILAYLEWKPDHLHKFDPNHQDKTFACPRTWFFAHKLVNGQPVDNNVLPLLAGTISGGVAQEFVQFCKIFADLPKMRDILAAPKTAPVPTEPSTKYAMASVVADHFTDKTAKELIAYIDRYPVEFQVVMLRMVHGRRPELMRHAEVAPLFKKLLQQM